MTTVEPEHLAYGCVQARFIISSMNQWNEDDGTFNYRILYYNVDKVWVADLLKWWNVQLFKNKNGRQVDHDSDDEANSDSVGVQYKHASEDASTDEGSDGGNASSGPHFKCKCSTGSSERVISQPPTATSCGSTFTTSSSPNFEHTPSSPERVTSQPPTSTIHSSMFTTSSSSSTTTTTSTSTLTTTTFSTNSS
ncbi:hypothetical protein BDN67DRAFT_1004035 [Paxillus ammoniavirescens]|nr:hypothetical protein BDN67DRAFT_1004035 [Paxillus ammoniavirescens]